MAERAAESNRIQKVLEGANIKLGSVATDILGKSGREMLQAIIGGEEDPEVLSAMAKGSMKLKSDEMCRALKGLLSDHQRQMLAFQMRHVGFLDAEIAALSREIKEIMRPFKKALVAIDEIPGIGERTAEQILAETGMDMSRFPTAGHFASWAGFCPGNNESAGKRKSGRWCATCLSSN